MAYNYDICIVGGLGHVGLPLGISLASAGKKVALYDVDRKAIDLVGSGKLPFKEAGGEAGLAGVLNKKLFVTSGMGVISESRYVIIVIGTPVDEHLNPRFTIFKKFFDEIITHIKDGQHVILRSTIYPGTTEAVVRYLEEMKRKVKVSYCPAKSRATRFIIL